MKLDDWMKSVLRAMAEKRKCLPFQLKNSILLLWRCIILSFIHSTIHSPP